jgi:CBS domain containing-hemolysin-like protein
MKEPLYLSQRKLLSDTLESLQMNKSHLAIVVDNLKNKNFMGIITLEDILEELVGEIYDEYDETPKHFFEIGNHLYHVGGKALLSEFFEEYLEDSKKPRTKAKTISEWILELAGRVRKNDVIYYDNLKMTILDKDKKVIKMIEVEEMTDYAEE